MANWLIDRLLVGWLANTLQQLSRMNINELCAAYGQNIMGFEGRESSRFVVLDLAGAGKWLVRTAQLLIGGCANLHTIQ
jgi:hypothetical protein